MQRARELLGNYKCYGFEDFRTTVPDDELLMGAAMTESGFLTISDPGKLMRISIALVGKLRVDGSKGGVLIEKGTRFLR